MSDIKLADVIDLNYLQRLQDSFSNATGMASISVDLNDSVTRESNFTDFCIKHTRGCREGLSRCLNCDLNGGNQAKETGRPAVYRCHAGLMDFAVPIMLKGKQIGSVIGGQVLPEPPDEDNFRRLALEFGIDPDTYIEALRKVPIVSERKIRAAAELLGIIVSTMAENYSKIHTLREIHSEIKGYAESVQSNLKNFSELLSSLDFTQTNLATEIQNITTFLKEINNVVASVSQLADETHMISFNASIEASRAGEFGKSFTIIADEIRRLSENSKSTVTNIQKITATIQKSIANSKEHSSEFSSSIKDQIKQLETVCDIVNSINNSLNKLYCN